jgi:opacity protein-like surface antigen
LRKCVGLCPVSLVRSLCLVVSVIVLGSAQPALSQTEATNPVYARVNTFGAFWTYSGTSSHMLLGYAQNRKLLGFGLEYRRRLRLGRMATWQYSMELLPVAFESDPVTHSVFTQQTPTPLTFESDFRQINACVPGTANFSDTTNGVTYSGTYTTTCTRTWTAGEAFSPVGFQWNFRPRHKLQPVVLAHGGYMYSSQAIPINYAGSFNFTFDVGAGLEFYHSKTSSFRADYRYHHISNHDTAEINPGIDSGVLQITYSIGR